MLSRTLRGLRLSALLVVVALATACAGSAAPDAPRAPLSQADLDALLVQDGDLPVRVTAELVRERVDWLRSVPAAPQETARRLVAQDGELGSVTLLVYPPGSDIATVYTPVSAVLERAAQRPPQFIGSIGERSGIVTTSPQGQPVVYDLSFLRCSAAAYIRLKTSEVDEVLQYARRLDQRLQQRICP